MVVWTKYPVSRYWRDGRVMPPHELELKFNEKVANCPFCGSGIVGMYMSSKPHMTCGKCGADGPICENCDAGDLDDRQYLAFEAWQHRVLICTNPLQTAPITTEVKMKVRDKTYKP